MNSRAEGGMVEVARIRAVIRLLGPGELTPTAKRMLESICDEAEEHKHSWRTEGDGNYEPFVSVCEDCGAVNE